jgi:hypothetical protein
VTLSLDGEAYSDDHASMTQDDYFPELEGRLLHLAEPLEDPGEGDWLAEHPEPGQTFRQYLSANPVRRGGSLAAIHLCLVGDFDGP